jgi:anaerobic ribonucleoside-triphosphate reductase
MVQVQLPLVQTTKMENEYFDEKHIVQSLIRETGISEETARDVTERVVRMIISSNIQWLSGPLIREFCCVVLAQLGLHDARKRYTRIGMPLYDYKQLLIEGYKENSNQYKNPESIHSWAANRISSEYALLDLIPEHLSHAHFDGDLHIHKLEYFDLRPFCASHDLRMIYYCGLPPGGSEHTSTSGPAKYANVAMLHAAKWLGIIQGSFSLPYCEKVLIEEDDKLQWRKIGEIVEENLETLKPIYTFSFNPQTLKVERQPITGVFKHQCWEQFLKIRTEYGREITITEHHSLFTLKDGKIVSIAGKDLQKGDYIVVPRQIHYDKPVDYLNLIDLIEKYSPSTASWYVRGVKKVLTLEQRKALKKIDKWAIQHFHSDSIPLDVFLQLKMEATKDFRVGMWRSPNEFQALFPITEDLCFLLGVFAAEGSGYSTKGSGRHGSISFSTGTHETLFRDEIKSTFYKVFGYDLQDYNPSETAVQSTAPSKMFRELFEDIFQCGHTAICKRVPFFIFGQPELSIRAFLRGYFLGDGHCRNSDRNKTRKRNNIDAKTVSKQLIEDINFLLLRLGIVASLYQEKSVGRFSTKNTTYILSIYGQHYLDILFNSFKEEDTNWKTETTRYNQSPIPLLLPTNHSGLRDHLGHTSELSSLDRGCINQKDRIGQQKVVAILNKLPKSIYKQNLLRYIEGDLTVLRIKQIEQLHTEEFAYDFEVKPNGESIENFIAGSGLVMAHNSGGQGYDHFTAFSSPYLTGLSDTELEQLAQSFFFETNQIFAARGGQVPFTSIHCSPEIPKIIADLPAVSLGGKINGIYGDYQDENQRFFDAICRVEMKGDKTGRLFAFPKHEIEIRKEWLQTHEDSYRLVHQEAAKMGTPYFILYPDWMPNEVHSQCCRLIMTKEGIKRFCHDTSKLDWAQSYLGMGSLQTVSINFPRLAYKANGDDDLLYEYLDEQLINAKDVLLIKKEISERTYKEDSLLNKMVPFPNGIDQPIFDLDRYSLTMGFVGLNEMLKYHLGLELHEGQRAVDFGKKFMQYMMDRLEEFSIENQYNFSAWETPAESTANRFAVLDQRKFSDISIVNGSGDGVYYTNSNHVRYNADVSLFDVIDIQSQFHPIIKGGVITHIWLGENHPDPDGLFQFTKRIMYNTPTAYLAYTLDFTECRFCHTFTAGRLTACPSCHSTDLEYWSRVTGYYSRVSHFSNGKKAEWLERKLRQI